MNAYQSAAAAKREVNLSNSCKRVLFKKKKRGEKRAILHVSSANHREHFVHASLPPDNVSFEFSQEVSTAWP